MWVYNINLTSRSSNLIIRARININNTANLDEYFENLNNMKEKLESMLPGSYKAKYSVGISGLVVQMTSKSSGEARRMSYQMENYIKSAIIALK